jgi:hypothetical protein
MKFDDVAQWVIAYGRLVIYLFAELALALGRMVEWGQVKWGQVYG